MSGIRKMMMGMGGLRDTTADGKQAVLVIGDSIAAGGAGTDVTLPASGTAYEFDRNTNTILEYGVGTPYAFVAGSFSNNRRAPWSKQCIDYNANNPTKKLVIINRGCSSSTISVGSNSNHWQTSGSNYNLAVTAANTCMAQMGVTKLKMINIILGINDAGGVNNTSANSVATVAENYATLLDNLIASFGSGVPILITIPGKQAATVYNTRLVQIRKAIRDMAVTYSNVYVGATMSWIFASGGSGDGLHPNATGNDWMGSMFARWSKYSTYTKWTRSIVSCSFTDYPDAKKILIQSFINSYESVLLNSLDVFYPFKGYCTDKKDSLFDWTFLCVPETDNGFTILSDQYISFTGGANNFATGKNDSIPINYTTNDFFASAYISDNAAAAATQAWIFAVRSNSSTLGIGQNTSNQIQWSVRHSAVEIYAGETRITDGEWRVQRSAANLEQLVKNNTVVDSAATAQNSAGIGNGSTVNEIRLGAYYNDLILTSSMNCKVYRFMMGKLSDISDWSAFTSALDTLQA